MVHKTTECLLYNLKATEKHLYKYRKGSMNRNDHSNSVKLGRNRKALHCFSRSDFFPSILGLQWAHIVNLYFCQSFFFFFSFIPCSFPALCLVSLICYDQLIWAVLMWMSVWVLAFCNPLVILRRSASTQW